VYIVHDYHGSQVRGLLPICASSFSRPHLCTLQGNHKHSTWASTPVDADALNIGILRLRTISHLPGGMENPAEALALRRSKYGLGDRRTIDAAVEFSGLGLYNRTVLGNKCGNLDFVPFKQHPLGSSYIPRFDEVTFAPLDEPDEGSIYYDMARATLTTSMPENRKQLRAQEKSVIGEKAITTTTKDEIPRIWKSRSEDINKANVDGWFSFILNRIALGFIFSGPVGCAVIISFYRRNRTNCIRSLWRYWFCCEIRPDTADGKAV
jgi:hypothetical protein